ncbi:hypothetical protein J1605_021794 [Eschrichtius robustus]|uniref:Uncharacterized protein n=1 Tax=Eschrichtius robustus TaxID=9764 RepID=A0AB34HAK4_ESCRO|nr:hypothetical protein J1605_021794 [Eschrichtius robustus]
MPTPCVDFVTPPPQRSGKSGTRPAGPYPCLPPKGTDAVAPPHPAEALGSAYIRTESFSTRLPPKKTEACGPASKPPPDSVPRNLKRRFHLIPNAELQAPPLSQPGACRALHTRPRTAHPSRPPERDWRRGGVLGGVGVADPRRPAGRDCSAASCPAGGAEPRAQCGVAADRRADEMRGRCRERGRAPGWRNRLWLCPERI